MSSHPHRSAFRRRRLIAERLEARELLAGDLLTLELAADNAVHPTFVVSSESAGTADFATTADSSGDLDAGEKRGEGEGDQGEGEQSLAVDLVAFAKALAQSGTKFFGAHWCPFCNQQKEMFEDGKSYLPFIEVTNPDRSINQVGIDNNITGLPTWEFPDGSREQGVVALDVLATRAGISIPQGNAPTMAPIADFTLQAGAPLWVPLDGYDPNGDTLTYGVSTDNPNLISLDVPQTNRSLKVSLQSWGSMTFQLFDNLVPRITNHVASLAESGFYNTTTNATASFDQVLQTGDVLWASTGGTSGTGVSSLGAVDDQFDVRLTHNAAGLLTLVQSADDGGDGRWAILGGPARSLDFDQPVFGALTEGNAVRAAINATALTGQAPTREIKIGSVSVFQDVENKLLMLSAPAGASGSGNVTVTVSDGQGHSFQQTFHVTVQPDTVNGGPFLKDILPQVTAIGAAVSFRAGAVDPEGDAVAITTQVVEPAGAQSSYNGQSGLVTVTPPTGYTGTMRVRVSASAASGVPNDTADPLDSQVVSIVVSATPAPYQNPLDALDVDADNFVAPRDALILINELNTRTITDANGGLPAARPLDLTNFYFYDPSGDNFATPRDALLIINQLNSPGGAGEGEEGAGPASWMADEQASSEQDVAVWDAALLGWQNESSSAGSATLADACQVLADELSTSSSFSLAKRWRMSTAPRTAT